MIEISKNRESRMTMPTNKKVYDHWKDSLDIQKYCCFFCGHKTDLQRSHIIDLSPNLDCETINNPENIHLLCRPCHKTSDIAKAKGLTYDEWFSLKQKSICDYTDNDYELLTIRRGFTFLRQYNSNLIKEAHESLKVNGKLHWTGKGGRKKNTELRSEIKEMLKNKVSYRKITEITGASATTIARTKSEMESGV
jgi:hypothetical protein